MPVKNTHDNKQAKLPTIPGYRIVKQLGTGGMATVYLANQERFDREVALKVMAPILAADSNYGDRFMREARIAARFSHPNIIAVYDVGAYEDHYYIAMEYHPGGDLKARLKRTMTTRQAMSILRQIAAGLDYAHSKGFIHRDVKPDNILFREDGSAVLTDFGIARTANGEHTQITQLGMVVGTPKYMSPEQARGQELGPRSDIYSLGIVFYEMLLGKVPFEGGDSIAIGIKHVKEPVPPLPPQLEALQPLIDGMLAKDATDRFASGRDLIVELDKLRLGALRNVKRDDSGQLAAVAAPPPPPVADAGDIRPADELRSPLDEGMSRRPRRRSKAAWLLLPLAIAAGGYYAWSSGKAEPLWQTITASPYYQRSADFIATLLPAKNSQTTAIQLPPVADVTATELPESTRKAASQLAQTSISAAIDSQLYPARLDESAIAAGIASALGDIDPATLPAVDLQARAVDRMLANAQALMNAGQLVAPAEDNALALYRQVLAIEAQNAEALEGQQVIAAHFVALGEQALSANSLDAAALHLQQARDIVPDIATLGALQNQLDLALQERDQRIVQARATAAEQSNRADAMLDQFKITGLLRSAEFDFAEGRYTRPQEGNALQKYQQVLQLDPGNSDAIQGLADIATQLELQLDSAIEAGETARAMNLLRDLQTVNPDSPRIQSSAP